MATLTAILCNYNHARYLPQALESYAAQAPWPQQLLVVDDASTDASREIIREFAARHAWVEVLLNERNRGWHASTNEALRRATGDYIYNGAADDYLLPGFFPAAMELARQNPSAGIVCGGSRQVDMDDRDQGTVRWEQLVGSQYVSPRDWRERILRSISPWNSLSPATLLKREAIREVGGYRRELGFWADTFVIRAIGFRTGVAYLDRECTCFRLMPGGMSGTAGRRPDILLQVRREALRLMRTPEFAGAFPVHHVRWWERATMRTIEAACSEELDESYQRLLAVIRSASETAGRGQRATLWCVRKLMSGLVRLARRIVGRQRRLAIEKSLDHRSESV